MRCVTFPELADCPPPGCAATALPVSLKGSWQLLLAAARVLGRKARPEGCLVTRKVTLRASEATCSAGRILRR